ESDDFSRTLREVFDEVFFPMLGVPHNGLETEIENFYDNIFPDLQGLTSPIPDAVSFVDWAFSHGYRIAIATDPLLPRKAAFHRLRWAGFDPGQFELVSSYEHFHFSKTHPAYYAEVLGRMGWQEGPVLMVGNDLERDILPAKRLGLAAWLVEAEPASSPGPEADRRGTLSDLREWLESSDVSSLTPSFQSAESIVAIMSAIPAALNGLSCGLSAEAWARKRSNDDWSLTELV
ncbi:MAG TPA: HAD family hydrolase, partial [Anaerolineales bacterium]|nr:HAD family hydrolase [Anaerolineales bacterium]